MDRGGRAGFAASHGRAILTIGAVSALGILASAGFQIVTIRGLGPLGFGLLASFLALVNIAAIGSSALRNSVAVATADAGVPAPVVAPRRFDSSLVEALVLGGLSTVGILVVAPLLAASLGANLTALALTAAVVSPYFLFSRAQGLLQGRGDSRSVVWWSTGAQVAQLGFTIVALALGLGAIGVLVGLLLTAVLGTVGASYQSRNIITARTTRPFSRRSLVVLLITLSFAWLTSIDVVLVQLGTSDAVAGAFAAAAVLIKTTLIIPATLSLYLLPKFVGRKNDASMTRLGVNVTLAITFVSGLLMFGLVTVAGERIVAILFGAAYDASAELLPLMALMWIPWAMAQGLLIRLTASSSRGGLLILVAAIGVQWVGSTLLLPDLPAMIILNGAVGFLALAGLFAIHAHSLHRLSRR